EVIVGVVGTLQFDVFEYRLKNEYRVDLVMENLPYEYVRWIDHSPVEDLDELVLGNGQDVKLVEDYQGNKLLLFSAPWSIKWVQDKNKGLEMSEFGGARLD
ncbi:MAG: peptide chain release factor 3, partial [Clostridiales bacterium]|nr:peptide chain release factor 3 [Clostridiales bacterium]